MTRNEDERIREALIALLKFGLKDGSAIAPGFNETKEQALAWLEKQGEKPQGKIALEDINEEKVDNQNCVKPTNKVEPIFKLGDWVVNRFGDVWHIDSFDKKNYQVSDGNGYYSYFPISVQDKMHLWTIRDAKDGDVLADKYNNIGIFQKCEGIYWYSYIYLGCDGKLRGFSIGGCHEQTDTHPATKEQRDTLMKAMTDAGYTFDFDKKELRKEEGK